MVTTTQKVLRVLTVLYALLIFGVSSIPGIHLPRLGITWSDTLAHFAEYFVFAFLAAGGWGRAGGLAEWSRQKWPLGLLILFSAIDEFHQIWIPRREASVSDWVADALGILSGFLFGLLVFRRHLRESGG